MRLKVCIHCTDRYSSQHLAHLTSLTFVESAFRERSSSHSRVVRSAASTTPLSLRLARTQTLPSVMMIWLFSTAALLSAPPWPRRVAGPLSCGSGRGLGGWRPVVVAPGGDGSPVGSDVPADGGEVVAAVVEQAGGVHLLGEVEPDGSAVAGGFDGDVVEVAGGVGGVCGGGVQVGVVAADAGGVHAAASIGRAYRARSRWAFVTPRRWAAWARV